MQVILHVMNIINFNLIFLYIQVSFHFIVADDVSCYSYLGRQVTSFPCRVCIFSETIFPYTPWKSNSASTGSIAQLNTVAAEQLLIFLHRASFSLSHNHASSHILDSPSSFFGFWACTTPWRSSTLRHQCFNLRHCSMCYSAPASPLMSLLVFFCLNFLPSALTANVAFEEVGPTSFNRIPSTFACHQKLHLVFWNRNRMYLHIILLWYTEFLESYVTKNCILHMWYDKCF